MGALLVAYAIGFDLVRRLVLHNPKLVSDWFSVLRNVSGRHIEVSGGTGARDFGRMTLILLSSDKSH